MERRSAWKTIPSGKPHKASIECKAPYGGQQGGFIDSAGAAEQLPYGRAFDEIDNHVRAFRPR